MRTVYYNGAVYTGHLPLREAFVVEDGRFVYAGASNDALELCGSAGEQVDLNGAFVCAGFNDSHMHLLNFGQSLTVAPLHQHTHSLEEMLQCLQNTTPGRGGWILGRGWNQDYFSGDKRMPTCPMRVHINKPWTNVFPREIILHSRRLLQSGNFDNFSIQCVHVPIKFAIRG